MGSKFEESWFDSKQVQNISLSSETFSHSVSYSVGTTVFFSQAVKCQGRAADHLRPSNVNVTEAYSYIFTLLYAFMTSKGTNLLYSFVSFTLLIQRGTKQSSTKTSHALPFGFAYFYDGPLAKSRHVIRKAISPANYIKLFCCAELLPKFSIPLRAPRSALTTLNIIISLQYSPN
jgi:hypothetical protein